MCGIVYVSGQVGLEKQQRKRERLSGELQSVVQFPAFARERLDPGFQPFFNKLVVALNLILSIDGDLLRPVVEPRLATRLRGNQHFMYT